MNLNMNNFILIIKRGGYDITKKDDIGYDCRVQLITATTTLLPVVFQNKSENEGLREAYKHTKKKTTVSRDFYF